jgi:MFS family permease
VLAGGLIGGILGPATSTYTVNMIGPRFTGAYLALIVFILVTIAILSRIRVPELSAAQQAAAGRPLAQIARQPKYVVAVMSGAIGYGVMNFLMTSTPLAMQVCGHSFADSAVVISSHVVAMFAPSFATGGLIKRLGAIPVMLAGALLNFVAIIIALSGVAVAQFWWALVLLGVGWNFLYIGATTLLTETYRPEERAKAQGANEFAIFAMMTLSSLSSGMIVSSAGWEKVNYAATPLVAVVICALIYLYFNMKSSKT